MLMMKMGRRCEDCRNKAKRECVYMRCRTCCNTKAFRCQTHIKSTWVPSYSRSSHKPQTQPQPPQPFPTTNPKRLREHQPPSFPSSSSGVQIQTSPGHLPAEMSCLADFRCIKVSSVGDGIEQYAYQTTVNIGGHVFIGILHDQGLDKLMLDHPSTHHHDHGQELLPPSRSSCPFTDFMSGSSHQKS